MFSRDDSRQGRTSTTLRWRRRMRYLKTLSMVVVLLFAGVGGLSADSDINQTFDTAFVVNNPCNNDLVNVTSHNHLLVHSTQASSGNFEFYSSLSSNYTGDGLPSGVSYQGSGDDTQDFSQQNPFPIIITFLHDVDLQSA